MSGNSERWIAKLIESARLRRAAKLRKAGDLDGAEALLQRLLNGNAKHLGALIQLAEMVATQKKWGEAVVRWEQALSVCDADKQKLQKTARAGLEKARMALAGEYRKSGDPDAALSMLSALLAVNPKQYAALAEKAEIHVDKSDWEEALTCYAQSLEGDRRRVSSVLQGMAAALKESGKLGHAQGVARGAALCGLADPVFFSRLLEGYAHDENWEAMVEVLSHALVINPQALANAHNARLTVEAFKKTGLSQNASILLSKAIQDAEQSGAAPQGLAILKEIHRKLESGADPEEDVSQHYYDDVYKKSAHYKAKGDASVYRPVWKEVVERIESSGYRKVLDLGCGPGQFAEYLLEKIPDIIYTGVDFSGVAIETAKQRCPSVMFRQADVLADEVFGDAEFDVVLLLEVLEHLHQDVELLKKTPPDSHLIASVPNFDSFGHARYFQHADDVKQRYAPLCSSLEVKPVTIKNKSVIYLVMAVTK